MVLGKPSPASTSVARSLRRWELAAHRRRAAVSRELGISDEELVLLLHLTEQGGATHAQLAALVGLSRSGAGAMIQRLEEAGVIERRPAASDKRVRLVDLTDRARRRLEEAYAEQSESVQRLLADRSPDEQELLSWLMGALADASEQQLGRAPAAGGELAAPPPHPPWRLWG